MIKILDIFGCKLLHLVPSLQACQFSLNPYPNKPRIVFREDGTLKITVFSDLHYGENPWDWWGPVQDSNSTRLMKRVLKDEEPDYVFATCSSDLFQSY